MLNEENFPTISQLDDELNDLISRPALWKINEFYHFILPAEYKRYPVIPISASSPNEEVSSRQV